MSQPAQGSWHDLPLSLSLFQEANEATASINMAVQHLEACVSARRASGTAEVKGELFSDVEAQVGYAAAGLAPAPALQGLCSDSTRAPAADCAGQQMLDMQP